MRDLRGPERIGGRPPRRKGGVTPRRRGTPAPTGATLRERILDRVRSYRQEIVDFTSRLVAAPTENPPGRFDSACLDLLLAKVRDSGAEARIVQAPGGDRLPGKSLVGHYGSGKKAIHFHGHYDVVPAQAASQFVPAVRNGKLTGRGSGDMKGGLAAMIFAVRAIRDCGIRPGGRIGFAFVPDEETGGERGAAHLAREGRIGRDGLAMLTAEPTGGIVWNANRGALTLRVRVLGRAAHVGLQFRGVNAFEHMLPVASALMELKRDVERRRTDYPIRPEAARHSILMLGGRCEGGTNFNAVPADCSFTLERRFNPEESLAEEKQEILRILDLFRASGLKVETEILQEAESAGTPADHPAARILADTIREVTEKPARFEICPGLLETRFYARSGIPAFAYGPGLLSVAHGPAEFVRVEDLLRCTAIYALTALRLLR